MEIKTAIYLSENSTGIEILTAAAISDSEGERIADKLQEVQIDPNHTFVYHGAVPADDGTELEFAADADEIVAAQKSA